MEALINTQERATVFILGRGGEICFDAMAGVIISPENVVLMPGN